MKTLKPIKWVKKDDNTWVSEPDGIAKVRLSSNSLIWIARILVKGDCSHSSCLDTAKEWCNEQLQWYYHNLMKQVEEIEREVGFEDIHTG